MAEASPRRIIVALTGASGSIYGVRLLQCLRELPQVEAHLILSNAGLATATQELDVGRADIESLADVVHGVRDVGASVASGSFATIGMAVVPCSMKTLAAIAHGLADNLVTRAADVVLKERRRLVLLARETPLNLVHIDAMRRVTEMGAIVCPPVPAFYTRPLTTDDLVDHTIGRLLDLFGLESPRAVRRWAGIGSFTGGRRTAGGDDSRNT